MAYYEVHVIPRKSADNKYYGEGGFFDFQDLQTALDAAVKFRQLGCTVLLADFGDENEEEFDFTSTPICISYCDDNNDGFVPPE